MKTIVLGASLIIAALAVSPAMAQSPFPQPQLSPYLFLRQGGQQGYLNYRQALDQQQPAPYTPPPQAPVQYNRTTSYQSNPQTTGFAPNTTTGHADTRGPAYTFMNYSHYYTTIRPPARPY